MGCTRRTRGVAVIGLGALVLTLSGGPAFASPVATLDSPVPAVTDPVGALLSPAPAPSVPTVEPVREVVDTVVRTVGPVVSPTKAPPSEPPPDVRTPARQAPTESTPVPLVRSRSGTDARTVAPPRAGGPARQVRPRRSAATTSPGSLAGVPAGRSAGSGGTGGAAVALPMMRPAPGFVLPGLPSVVPPPRTAPPAAAPVTPVPSGPPAGLPQLAVLVASAALLAAGAGHLAEVRRRRAASAG